MQNQYLRDGDIDFYRDNGYLILDPIFPKPSLTKALEDVVELLQRKRERLFPNDQRTRETESELHRKSQAVQELIASDVFEELCRRLLGKDIDLRFCFTVTKTAEHGGPVEWHQDWGLDQDRGFPRISFWIAITESNIENGCIRVIPGSHKLGIQPHFVSETCPPDLCIKKVDAQKAVPLEMKAGEVLILHPQVIHGSGSSTSKNPRVAVLGSYQIPKKSYNEFWANAGVKFLRQGKKVWAALEESTED